MGTLDAEAHSNACSASPAIGCCQGKLKFRPSRRNQQVKPRIAIVIDDLGHHANNAVLLNSITP